MTPAIEIARTPFRSWAVLLLFRGQQSSAALVSYTFGLFLPFIREDLNISSLEAGLLQGVWWMSWALLSLPFGVRLSRFRPVPLILVSLILGAPFLFLQALAFNFWMLLLARLFFISTHVMNTPARALLLHQWVAPRHYAKVLSLGLSQHSVMLALAVSLSPLLIEGLGSWRLLYLIMGGLFVLQIVAWRVVARDEKALLPPPPPGREDPAESPLQALRQYPQGWLVASMMLCLSATWTGMVTFLPTLWLEERAVPLTLSGPLLGFLYYGLIPSGFFGGMLAAKLSSRKLLLAGPALLNVVFALAITLSEEPPLLMALITGLGLIWTATPAIEVLPFEFPGITPRQAAVIIALIVTFMGIGFAVGPMVVGIVAQLSGSIQTGLLVMALLTGVGVVAGLAYPNRSGN